MLNKYIIFLCIIIIVSFTSLIYTKELPLPEGEGKALILSKCNLCHGLDVVINQRLSKLEWEDIVNRMIRWGAPISSREQEIIVEYLYKNFGQK
ncbi:MAG: hypothetical protein RMI63_03590 [Caldimicrobium sp.]|nr:hypothetical protein [Caldimicrobium sp.]MDW8094094.1 hypothetical protein [Caldimicrobium sp.]